MHPRPRTLSPSARVDALAAVEATRRACIRVCAEAKIDGVEYEATGKAIEALDGLAGALTGNPELFCPKPNGVASGG